MTRASELNRLQTLGALGNTPRQLFEALLALPEHLILHALQKGLRA
jgi:hypothetical protein